MQSEFCEFGTLKKINPTIMHHQKIKDDPTHSGDYTIYTPNAKDTTIASDYIQSMSIDPGSANLCMRIERRNFSDNSIYPIYYENVSIKSEEKVERQNKNDPVISQNCNNLYNQLNGIKDIIKECHYVVIERQLPINTQATSVMNQIIALLHVFLDQNNFGTKIYAISPKIKNIALGKVGKLTKPELKKLSIYKAIILLLDRGDSVSLDKMLSFNKMDDYADVVTQNESFSILKAEVMPKIPLTKKNEKSLGFDYLEKLIKEKKLSKAKREEILSEVKKHMEPGF